MLKGISSQRISPSWRGQEEGVWKLDIASWGCLGVNCLGPVGLSLKAPNPWNGHEGCRLREVNDGLVSRDFGAGGADGRMAMACSRLPRAGRLGPRSRSWVTQSALDVARQGPAWTASLRGYGTWLDPQSGKGLQVRWRRRGPCAWDVRVKGIPGKHAFLNWSFVGDGQSSMLGIHATTRELRCTWWLGRGTNGSWSQAHHVECVWRMDEGFSAGFVGMAGRGDVSDAFVMVPALDARRWSRLPHHGQRMGLWCAKRHEGHGWTLQWTWSPSQQETFRCAMRWRWDA